MTAIVPPQPQAPLLPPCSTTTYFLFGSFSPCDWSSSKMVWFAALPSFASVASVSASLMNVTSGWPWNASSRSLVPPDWAASQSSKSFSQTPTTPAVSSPWSGRSLGTA